MVPRDALSRGLNRTGVTLAASLVMLLVGCEHNRYEIELTPRGAKVERRLTMGRAVREMDQPRPATSDAELDHLRPLFESHERLDENKHRFSGTFGATMPLDVGGQGRYLHYATRLGTLWIYAERFRGNDDLAGQLDERRAAARRLAELLGVWLKGELGDRPGYGRLETFVAENLRRDLENVAVYAWLAGAANDASVDEDDTGEAVAAQLAQYVVEREYVETADLPSLIAIDGDQPEPLLRLARKLLARKLELADGDEKDALAVLADVPRLKASLDRHLADTPEYRAALEAWKESAEEGTERPKPHELLGDLSADIIGFELTQFDTVELRLRAPREPFATNGVWDSESKQVDWEYYLSTRDAPAKRELPAFAYAAWAVPDEEAQKRHFGETVLDESDLATYCLWWAGLDEEQGTEWDTFLGTARPVAGLKERLKAFRFTGDQPDDTLAKPAISAILSGLNQDGDE